VLKRVELTQVAITGLNDSETPRGNIIAMYRTVDFERTRHSPKAEHCVERRTGRQLDRFHPESLPFADALSALGITCFYLSAVLRWIM
jgi:hypothetical protein